METSELYLPAIVLGLIVLMLAMGIHRRVIAKLGVRNFLRHKGHTVISVAGLLIGTSIICASMVVGDSIEYFIVEETYEQLQVIDVLISEDNGGTFDESIYTTISSNNELSALTDGISPLLVQSVSVRQQQSGLFEPSVSLIGFDAVQDEEFGLFTLSNGEEINGAVTGNNSVINRELANSLDADVGDTIDLTYTIGNGYMGYGDIHSQTLTISYIVEDEGKAQFNPGSGMNLETYNIYVDIDTAQDMLDAQNMISMIKISNIGGVESGTDGTEEVLEAIEPLIQDLTFNVQNEMLIPIPMGGANISMLSNSNLDAGSLVLTTNGTVMEQTPFMVENGGAMYIILGDFVMAPNGSFLPVAPLLSDVNSTIYNNFEFDESSGMVTFVSPPPMTPVFAEYSYTFILEAEGVKQDSLEMAQDINELLSTFLTIFGSFAILAGVILIINIFTMLAEERKSELGMARAVGMKRRHLMQSFLFEGLAYGSVASAMGTIVGVVIGWILIYMINNIANIMAGVVIPFHFENFSLIQAFSTGFIITFATILFTSWRISNLNIIRAIRGIEEPVNDRKGWKIPLLGALLVVVSSVMMFQMWNDEFMVKLLAPSGIITGLAMLLWRWIGDRISVTSATLGVFLYTYYAIRTYFGDADMGNLEMPFILSGVLIVLSLVLLIMYNSKPVIMMIVNSIGRAKKFRPTVMTAVSYPLSKKFRTGMSVAMFALVVYMIVMLSVFSNIFVMDLDEETLKEGGGYHIIANAQNPVIDIYNVTDPVDNTMITSSVFDHATISQVSQAYAAEANVTEEVQADEGGMGFGFGMFSGAIVYGIDDQFHEGRSFEFMKVMEEFEGQEVSAVWEAVTAPDSNYIIYSSMMAMMSQVSVGNHLTFTTFTGDVTEEYQVIGIVDQSTLNGAFMSKPNVIKEFGMMGMANSVFLIDVGDGQDIQATADAMEKDFAALGMNSVIVEDMVESSMEMMNSMFVLFELYLYMGMVVGVAGLGIITIRSVVERTPEIGILRSIGFKKKNVRNAFLIEILFVATMGVLIGTLAGIMVSYEIFNVMISDMGGDIEYVIPWAKIALVTAIAYIATILCTIIPAMNASKTSPSEALRYVG